RRGRGDDRARHRRLPPAGDPPLLRLRRAPPRSPRRHARERGGLRRDHPAHRRGGRALVRRARALAARRGIRPRGAERERRGARGRALRAAREYDVAMTTPPYVPPPTAPPPPPPPPAPAVTPPPQKSSGCLKWGLIGCGVVVVLIAAFCAVLMIFVFGAMKRSHVYKGAVERAQNDPRVKAALGEPIETGWWVSGSVHVENSSGNAELT